MDGAEHDLEVLVADDLCYDALLGRDVSELWEIGKSLLYDDLIRMVQMRSNKTEPLQELTTKHREPRDQKSDNSDDSEESENEDCPFTSDGRTKYELPDEHNNSGDDSDVSEDVAHSSNSAQAAGEECDIVDDPDNLVEAKVMLDKKTSQSQQKSNSRVNRRKTRADYIAGRPGHRLDVTAEQLRQDQEVDDFLAGGGRRPKWVMTDLSSKKGCTRESDIGLVRICCNSACLSHTGL